MLNFSCWPDWLGVVGMLTGVPWRVRGFELPRLWAVELRPFEAGLLFTLLLARVVAPSPFNLKMSANNLFTYYLSYIPFATFSSLPDCKNSWTILYLSLSSSS